jgi:CubicO group peptidase (beta-lactamase class C family)
VTRDQRVVSLKQNLPMVMRFSISLKHSLKSRFLTLSILVLSSLVLPQLPVSAQNWVEVVPETVGVSSKRLKLLDDAFNQLIEQQKLPGTVTMVMRDGKVIHYSALGMRDKEGNVPMQRDSMFRIASQTKAVVSVAVMLLQEDGRLNINDPLGRYMPEFMQTNVAQATDSGYDVVPAKRPITIRDLLTHTAGVAYGNGLGEDLWKRAGIEGWYFADRDEPIRDVVRRIAKLPFQAQPGEQWVYGYSTDILGALVEVISGQPLDIFLKSRIFDPIGMGDTHFFVPEYKAARLATVYSYENGKLTRAPDGSGRVAQGDYVTGPRRCFSGGAGLVSTAPDYAAFLQMLLNDGVANGVRVMSRKSVELMRVNHLPPEVSYPWGAGLGFGLGFSVVEDVGLRGELGTEGEYGWGGAYNSAYWIDPKERLVVVYFTQVIPAQNLNDHQLLRNLIYQAIAD